MIMIKVNHFRLFTLMNRVSMNGCGVSKNWHLNRSRYEKAIKACALDKDIEDFNHGDLTEIGERGLNLSGGHKQRIQLAQAVYNDTGIYLLDDPFSAVDAHTAASLFNIHGAVYCIITCFLTSYLTLQGLCLLPLDFICVPKNISSRLTKIS